MAPGRPSPTALLTVLAEARAAGFLGPGPLEVHLAHAEGFVSVARRLALDPPRPPRLVDLGSGGGLPGLVVATSWPESTVALIEANGRRARFLRQAVDRLGLEASVSVLEERAEVCGRQDGLRGSFGGALARSFGPPAVVAECAAPLLEPGGFLVTSEPPGSADQEALTRARWPAEGLKTLGLEPLGVVRDGFDYMTLRMVSACPERFPRRNGVPSKRPLF
jgi:16S rRNA (guanine527-N7)-methyltransferase